jgi:hypothetical protein
VSERRSMTDAKRADIFFTVLTGMTTHELARKIVKDYNEELKREKEEKND